MSTDESKDTTSQFLQRKIKRGSHFKSFKTCFSCLKNIDSSINNYKCSHCNQIQCEDCMHNQQPLQDKSSDFICLKCQSIMEKTSQSTLQPEKQDCISCRDPSYRMKSFPNDYEIYKYIYARKNKHFNGSKYSKLNFAKPKMICMKCLIIIKEGENGLQFFEKKYLNSMKAIEKNEANTLIFNKKQMNVIEGLEVTGRKDKKLFDVKKEVKRTWVFKTHRYNTKKRKVCAKRIMKNSPSIIHKPVSIPMIKMVNNVTEETMSSHKPLIQSLFNDVSLAEKSYKNLNSNSNSNSNAFTVMHHNQITSHYNNNCYLNNQDYKKRQRQDYTFPNEEYYYWKHYNPLYSSNSNYMEASYRDPSMNNDQNPYNHYYTPYPNNYWEVKEEENKVRDFYLPNFFEQKTECDTYVPQYPPVLRPLPYNPSDNEFFDYLYYKTLSMKMNNNTYQN